MKNVFRILPVAAVVALAVFAFKPAADITALEIGSKAPNADQQLNDVISGKDITLNGSMKEKGLLVIFSCNTCPFVIANEDRIKAAAKQASDAHMGVVIINSNEAKRGDDDSPAAMKAYAAKQGFECAYVIDPKSAMADAFGAMRTPETFLFDKKGVLVYHGAIDDNPKDAAAATAHYLHDAIDAVAKGEEVKVKTSRSIGCSIKRLE